MRSVAHRESPRCHALSSVLHTHSGSGYLPQVMVILWVPVVVKQEFEV